jgi:hypothetical protein
MSITTLLASFLAGFLAVLIFHQGVWAIFAAAKKTPRPAWDMARGGPFGVPAVINAAFWGGIWGIAMTAIVLPLFKPALGEWLTSIVVGGVLTSVVALLVVFPLKGMKFAAGWNPAIWIFALLVNCAWGFGFGLLFRPIADLLKRFGG